MRTLQPQPAARLHVHGISSAAMCMACADPLASAVPGADPLSVVCLLHLSHIAKTLKTVPLEKVQVRPALSVYMCLPPFDSHLRLAWAVCCHQDVELQSNCLLSCFGLKAVNVQTAGQGTIAPEVSATFLRCGGDVNNKQTSCILPSKSSQPCLLRHCVV